MDLGSRYRAPRCAEAEASGLVRCGSDGSRRAGASRTWWPDSVRLLHLHYGLLKAVAAQHFMEPRARSAAFKARQMLGYWSVRLLLPNRDCVAAYFRSTLRPGPEPPLPGRDSRCSATRASILRRGLQCRLAYGIAPPLRHHEETRGAGDISPIVKW